MAEIKVGAHPLVVPDYLVEDLFGKVYEVHLVDTYDYLFDCEERGYVRMTDGLFHDAMSGVYQNHGEVCSGGSRNHVPGVLDMARSVRNDEFSFRSSEITIGYVDGDALLTLRSESVGEKREIDFLISTAPGCLLDSLELVLED